MTKHKCALAFLALINVMNIAAGIITQLKLITGSDVTSVIPITINLSVVQILMLNFMVVAVIFSLISVVVTYLVCDAPYSLWDIIQSAPALFMIVPIALLFVAGFNTISASSMADKVIIIVCAMVYLFLNLLNFGAVITIKEDE